jgi:hypothetical protein
MFNYFAICLIVLLLTGCAGQPATGPALTADNILAALKSANLEAENARELTKDDYGLAPFVCQGKRFFIPSLGKDSGGRLFVCDNNEDRDKLAEYYKKLGESSAAFFSWTFARGNVLLQLNGNLPEAEAKKYEAALNGLK